MSEDAPVTERRILVERRLKLTERACTVCGTVFVGWGKASLCSRACTNRQDYERHAEARRAARRARHQRDKAKKSGHGDDVSSPTAADRQRPNSHSEMDS